MPGGSGGWTGWASRARAGSAGAARSPLWLQDVPGGAAPVGTGTSRCWSLGRAAWGGQEGKACPGPGAGQAEPGCDGFGELGSPSHCAGHMGMLSLGEKPDLPLLMENPFLARSH